MIIQDSPFCNWPGFSAFSIGAQRAELKKALHKYNNTYRPHNALNEFTSMAYMQHAHTAGHASHIT